VLLLFHGKFACGGSLQHEVIHVFTGEYHDLNLFLLEHSILKLILCPVKCSLETADAGKIKKMLVSLLLSPSSFDVYSLTTSLYRILNSRVTNKITIKNVDRVYCGHVSFVKIRMCKTIILPVVLNGCENFSLT
jgi:hypothetical protein